MKKPLILVIVFSVFLTFGAIGVTWADPWAVVSNYSDRTIHTIDLGTESPTVHGPFLAGELGTSGQILDVAVMPDGPYALVSNFNLRTIYRIDLSDPTNPVFSDSVDIGFPAEDIAIAPNGQFALVVDGFGWNQMAIIDLSSFSLTNVYALTTEGAAAQAIAIAPDSKTVIICDYYDGRIIYGELDPSTGLISENALSTGGGPINVAISPDGQTALVANAYYDDTVSVFRITGPGDVEIGVTATVSGLPGGQQSIAFSPDGQRAYVVSLDPSRDRLSWLEINGPGDVTLGGAGVTELLTDTGGGFFGVDILAVTPDGSHALVGNPSNSAITPPGLIRNVAMVDLFDWSMAEIITDSDFPVGIAVFSQHQPVHVDIKPGSCPNPLNLKSKGVLPVAILGTESFDVTTIDVSSILLGQDGNGGGAAPIRWSYEDVAMPFVGEFCGCHEVGPDGYMDLTLKFDTQEVVEVLGDVVDRENRVLTISGELDDGTSIEGNDCVVILARGYQGIKVKGGKLTRLDFIDPSTIADTQNRPNDLIYGLIDMEIEVDKPGATATVTVSLPTPAPDGFGWYKYSPSQSWYDFSADAVFNTNRDQVTITLTDGDIGDDDGVANGTIADPSGLGTAPVSGGDAATSGGGGGGGCFVSVLVAGSHK